MPVGPGIDYGAAITSATISDNHLTVTAVVVNAGEEIYGHSAFKYSSDSGATWTAFDSIDSWANEEVVASVVVPLGGGGYGLQMTTSDGVTVENLNAFSIPGGDTDGQSMHMSFMIAHAW